jgi:hypothetical protein
LLVLVKQAWLLQVCFTSSSSCRKLSETAAIDCIADLAPEKAPCTDNKQYQHQNSISPAAPVEQENKSRQQS